MNNKINVEKLYLSVSNYWLKNFLFSVNVFSFFNILFTQKIKHIKKNIENYIEKFSYV